MASARGRPERVVLDTNALASALAFGGVPGVVLELGRSGRLAVFLSGFILGELRETLASRRFGWDPQRIEKALDRLKAMAQVLEPRGRLDAIRADEKDNRILECAVAAAAEVLVTGNMKHIRPLGRFRDIEILTPRELLDKYFPAQ